MNNLLLRRTDTRYRPLMHFSAEKGWINDPNGLIYFKGKYHLFYQHNPHSAVWSSMHWGHAISTDMLHWEDLPIALYPDADYDKDSEGGCFSGSAIEKDGRLYLMYTGTVHRNGNCYQTQNIAYSDDGITFTKYKNNPVIYKPEGAGEDFRDPKIFFYDGLYYAVIGGTIDNDGKVFLYTSSDILHWEYKGILFDSEGKVATMIECPDFFFLDGHWVLIFSPIGNPDRRKCIYYAGDMDFNTCRFTPRWNGIMDYGPDFYAPQTFLDKNGNRVIIAWMNRWQYHPVMGYVVMVYRHVLRPLFASRMESSAHNFRGMFGWCRTSRRYEGDILVLPDHLEDKAGYLAHHVQALQKRFHARLVRLEDPEFERHFVVYADSEVSARMLLTPAMMRRMTALRDAFGRDLMFSFSRGCLYYAASMPQGFLRLRPASLGGGRMLETVFNDITLSGKVADELGVS